MSQTDSDMAVEVSTMILELIYGDQFDIDTIPDESLRRISTVSEEIVSLSSHYIDEFLNDHSFICSDCRRRVSGEPEDIGQDHLCPGCMNFRALSHETIRRGLSRQPDFPET